MTRSAPTMLQISGLRLILPILLLAALLYVSGPGGISTLILPEPLKVADEFVALFGADYIAPAALLRLTEIGAAFLLAAGGGILVGFLLSRTTLRALEAEPVLALAHMFPFVLLYPLFLLWMGVGMFSKITYAAIAQDILVAYNTLRRLLSVGPRYIWVGISVVLIGVVLAELLGSNVGLGFELQRATNAFKNGRVFLVLFLIIVTSTRQWGLERLVNRRWR